MQDATGNRYLAAQGKARSPRRSGVSSGGMRRPLTTDEQLVSTPEERTGTRDNNYRLVTAMDFEKRIVWIKWIGTHGEYDSIDVKTVAYERPKTDPE